MRIVYLYLYPQFEVRTSTFDMFLVIKSYYYKKSKSYTLREQIKFQKLHNRFDFYLHVIYFLISGLDFHTFFAGFDFCFNDLIISNNSHQI